MGNEMSKNKITFKVKGRTVSAQNFGRQFGKAVTEEVHSRVIARIRTVRCPVHNQSPTDVRVESLGGSQVKYVFNSCCPELEKAAGAAFS